MKEFLTNYTILLFFIVFPWTMKAQSGCIDSSNINWTTICQQTYDPVCGCNAKTYINQCEAVYHAGVIQYTPGPCEALSMNIYPNSTSRFFTIEVFLKEKKDVIISIYDMYGRVWYEGFQSQASHIKQEYDGGLLPTGFYSIVAITPGFSTFKKLFLTQ